MLLSPFHLPFFFFNDTATTEIYTLSLHDALPIWRTTRCGRLARCRATWGTRPYRRWWWEDGGTRRTSTARSPIMPRSRDRKSTRLNSSHLVISYAVFCLKKKNTNHG